MFSSGKLFCASDKIEIHPPIVTNNTVYNINDFDVRVIVEYDAAGTWMPLTLAEEVVPANGSRVVTDYMFFKLRAKCISTSGALSVSEWSDGYSYPNSYMVQPPIVTGTTAYNINDFDVRVVAESWVAENLADGAWKYLSDSVVSANGSWAITNTHSIIRARCFPDPGNSVSSWSNGYLYLNTQNLQPPTVSNNTIQNPNNIEVKIVAEKWNEGVWEHLADTVVAANGTWTIPDAPSTIRALCFSGISVSGRSDENPTNVQPPVVSNNRVYNLNDFEVKAHAEIYAPEQSLNGVWTILNSAVIPANGYHDFDQISISSGTLRARCASTGAGRVSVSKYSEWTTSYWNPTISDYPYSNSDDIQTPLVTYINPEGDVRLTNPNNFEVVVVLESPYANGTWTGGITDQVLQANQILDTSITVTGANPDFIPRARCFSTGAGTSVSPWSRISQNVI